MSKGKHYKPAEMKFIDAYLEYVKEPGARKNLDALADILDRPKAGIAMKVNRMAGEQLTMKTPRKRVTRKSDPQTAPVSHEITKANIRDHVGAKVTARVERVMTYGAFCRVNHGDASLLMHISKIKPYYIEDLQRIIAPGDEIPAVIVIEEATDRLGLASIEWMEGRK